ncbi:MAG: response regulator, partial [Pseudomonadota bacterium]
MILQLVTRALEAAGHEVSSADDGDTALQRLRHETFDLVITDIIMPGKEGIELILELRRLQPDLPIIAMSGGHISGGHDVLDAAQRLGAIHTLAKPFGPRDLVR